MDYHIDWLYASLNLAKDNNPAKVYPNEKNVIKGQQEDIDWLIAFKGQSKYHLVLIEAKGVTGWSNKILGIIGYIYNKINKGRKNLH